MSCFCNIITVEIGGGIKLSGSALDTTNAVSMSGGLRLSGRATVDVSNQVYDGFEMVMPLDETGPFYDRAKYGLVGNYLSELTETERVDGIGCSRAQRFTVDETTGVGGLINVDVDGMDSSEFTLSFWLVPQHRAQDQAIIFRRGLEPFSFQVGYSSFSFTGESTYIFASAIHADGETSVWSKPIKNDAWYHIGVVVADTMKIYVNGVLDDSIALPTMIEPIGLFSSFGAQASYPVCTMQEFRLWPEAVDADYLADERKAMCGIVEVGEVMEI